MESTIRAGSTTRRERSHLEDATALQLGHKSCTCTIPLVLPQVLDVEIVMLNEFLGAYPNYITGVSTCPFFSFKRYQFNKDQHYR